MGAVVLRIVSPHSLSVWTLCVWKMGIVTSIAWGLPVSVDSLRSEETASFYLFRRKPHAAIEMAPQNLTGRPGGPATSLFQLPRTPELPSGPATSLFQLLRTLELLSTCVPSIGHCHQFLNIY